MIPECFGWATLEEDYNDRYDSKNNLQYDHAAKQFLAKWVRIEDIVEEDGNGYIGETECTEIFILVWRILELELFEPTNIESCER